MRWFLPADDRRLRIRRAALRMAELPGLGRILTTGVTGSPTRVIADLAR